MPHSPSLANAIRHWIFQVPLLDSFNGTIETVFTSAMFSSQSFAPTNHQKPLNFHTLNKLQILEHWAHNLLSFYLFNRSLGFQKLQKTEHNESNTWREKWREFNTLDQGDDVSAITHYDIKIN